jgi:hypothetical protein
LQTLLDDPPIGPEFVKGVRGGRVKWNKDRCKRWLKRTLETMAAVIHVIYDQLAWAEELATVNEKS